MKICVGYDRADSLESLSIGTGDEQTFACGDDAGGDGGNLLRRLSRPKDDLREPLAQAAVPIQAGEGQILERGLA